jgi:hypothetical protein
MTFKTFFKLQKEAKPKKRKKYNSISCRCALGHIHDSRLEAAHCPTIHLMAKDKTKGIIKVERQVTFPLVVNGHKICDHRPDFLLTYKDGHQEIIESKGFENPVWPIKKALFEALYPEITYSVWR